MGRRTSTKNKSYGVQLKEVILHNKGEIEKKYKEIGNTEFDAFAKWFGNNILKTKCFVTLKRILKANGFSFKQSNKRSNAWSRGFYV